MFRKSWKIELRGSNNHEKSWKMRSGRRLGGTWCPRWPQKPLWSPRLVNIETNLGVILGAIFDQNPYCSASFFSWNFGRHFLRILMDFGAHFHDFWAPKSTPNPKRRKYEKPMFYLHETYVLEGPGLSFLVRKSIKNDVGTRCGIGTDFFMIFNGFWPPFWGPKSQKFDKKTM